MSYDFDVLVIGSGFGGSVAALRLTEKGYRVLVVEAGARFEDQDFAPTSFDVKKYLFRPEIGCYGIQRIDALRDCLILSGAGVGGGSLVYANTLYEPLKAFYEDGQWRDITDWRSELALDIVDNSPVDRAEGRSLVINQSQGMNGGGHSGESLLETAIDNLLRGKGTVAVKSAGNEQLWRIHAGGNVGDGTISTREFNIDMGNDRITILEAWFDDRDTISISALTENAASTDTAPKAAAPIIRMRRRPMRSPSVPMVTSDPATKKP